MIEYLFLIFIVGFFVKSVDFVVDEKIKIRNLDIILGFFYGFLIAFIASKFQIFSSLVFAVIVAVILAKKIDALPHIIGVLTFIIFILLFGIPKLDLIQLLVFLFAAFIDEIAKDLSEKKRVKGFLSKIFNFRPFLDIITFVFSALTGLWILFAGILIFDVGYKFCEFLLRRIYKSSYKRD